LQWQDFVGESAFLQRPRFVSFCQEPRLLTKANSAVVSGFWPQQKRLLPKASFLWWPRIPFLPRTYFVAEIKFCRVFGFSGRRKSVCCRKQVFCGGKEFPFCQEPILLPKENFAVVFGFSGRRESVCCRKQVLVVASACGYEPVISDELATFFSANCRLTATLVDGPRDRTRNLLSKDAGSNSTVWINITEIYSEIQNACLNSLHADLTAPNRLAKAIRRPEDG